MQAALGMLSRMLHCKPGTLGIAGTKDKRSISAQHLTAWQVCSAAYQGQSWMYQSRLAEGALLYFGGCACTRPIQVDSAHTLQSPACACWA